MTGWGVVKQTHPSIPSSEATTFVVHMCIYIYIFYPYMKLNSRPEEIPMKLEGEDRRGMEENEMEIEDEEGGSKRVYRLNNSILKS